MSLRSQERWEGRVKTRNGDPSSQAPRIRRPSLVALWLLGGFVACSSAPKETLEDAGHTGSKDGGSKDASPDDARHADGNAADARPDGSLTDGRSDASSTFELQTPNPLSVSPVLDSAHAVTATIVATAGGSIKTKGADGTTYSLEIPKDALLDDTVVTLTPVAKIGGLPFSGGLQAAVEIAPDGLELYRLATLTIDPAKAVPASRQIGFGYHGTGTNFHLEALTTTALSFGLVHFSGYGDGLGTAADVSEEELHPPTAFLDQLVQDIAQPFFLERPDKIEKDPPLPTPESVQQTINTAFQTISQQYSAAYGSTNLDAMVTAATSESAFALQCEKVRDTTTEDKVVAEMSNLAAKYSKLVKDDLDANCGTLSDAQLSTYASKIVSWSRITGSTPAYASDLAQCKSCRSTCKPPNTKPGSLSMCCGLTCKATVADSNNCGACGNKCTSEQYCSGGTCVDDDDGGVDAAACYYCGCNGATYSSSTACVDNCHVTLGCFATNICGYCSDD